MRARGRSAWAAAGFVLLFAGLVSSAYLLFERPAREEEARRRSEVRVLAFAPAEVREVRLARGGKVAVLDRTASGWSSTVAAGAATPVDAEAAEAYLARLAALRRGAALPPGDGGLARYGLDPPRARLEIDLDGGRTLSLDLGDESPFDHTVFARAGGEVLVLPASARTSIALDRGALRPRAPPDGGNRG